MNRSNVKTMLCAALAIVSSAAIAQEQPQFTPAATARLTTDASTSTIIRVDGSRVIDAAGQPLGRIENIVLSPVGCAEAAILTAANGRLVPIPWTLVRVSGDTRAAGSMPGANLVFTMNVDQARLAQAPSFVRTQWPDMTTQAWLQPSVTFFGSTAVGATGSGTSVTTGASGAIGTTATGANVEGRIGTTATGGTNQSRIGAPATTVPTNSTGVLPPTGRPSPNRPDFNQPTFPPTSQNSPPPSQGIPPQNRNVPQQPQAPPAPQAPPPPATQP